MGLEIVAGINVMPDRNNEMFSELRRFRIVYNSAMRQTLTLHPHSICTAVTQVEAEATRPSPTSLAINYFVTGKMNDLVLPAVATPIRSDELWRHTCFEAFVRTSHDEGYDEFNFAPSRQWAAYRFSSYRSGMSAVMEISTPHIEVLPNEACFELQVSLELNRLPGLSKDATWRLGLSAVIEETNGRKSYWALAHPPGKADFHHSVCFACELPAA